MCAGLSSCPDLIQIFRFHSALLYTNICCLPAVISGLLQATWYVNGCISLLSTPGCDWTCYSSVLWTLCTFVSSRIVRKAKRKVTYFDFVFRIERAKNTFVSLIVFFLTEGLYVFVRAQACTCAHESTWRECWVSSVKVNQIQKVFDVPSKSFSGCACLHERQFFLLRCIYMFVLTRLLNIEMQEISFLYRVCSWSGGSSKSKCFWVLSLTEKSYVIFLVTRALVCTQVYLTWELSRVCFSVSDPEHFQVPSKSHSLRAFLPRRKFTTYISI